MTTNPPPRIAIAQVQMHWTIEDNLADIHRAMHLAARHGAGICAFSELAVTGIHRQIVALAHPQLVAPALQQVRAWCAELGLAVSIGAPTFGNAGERFITQLLLDASGAEVAAIRKRGLTDPEATFFSRGSGRPVGLLQGLRCSAVICREVGDLEQVRADLPPGSVDVVFVPGALRQDPEKPPSDPPAYVDDMRAVAVATGATVIQTNWPNALNRPEESRDAGRSGVVSPQGQLLLRLPKEAAGVGLVELGSPEFEWLPM